VGSGREVPYIFDDVLTKEAQLVYLHTAESMKKLLENAGFGSVEVISTVFDMSAATQNYQNKEKVMLAFTAKN